MTDKEFTESRNAILNYCERNNLQTEVSDTEHEVDFIMDFGMEAIDRDTLENPTCINTEKYILVFLPRVSSSDADAEKHDWERSRNVYMNIASGLMETAKPDYLIGAENGIVKAVMYCVWAD